MGRRLPDSPSLQPGAPVCTAAASPSLARRPAWRRLALGLGLLGALGLSTRVVRLNVSPSVPLGLYRLAALETPLRVGTLVLLPVPAVVRPWWSSWWIPLLKPVAAVAGDEVCIEQGWLRVAGAWYGPVLTEAHGKPLPQWRGCVVVPEDAVFLATDKPGSLDGRYFGMTRVADLTAQAVPLLTWR